MWLSNDHTVLNSVLSTMVDGVVVIDRQGRIRLFNPACEAMFGYAEDEVLGENVHVLMPEPYHSEHDGYLANYQSTGVARIIGIGREVRGRRKTGEVFPMYLSVGENTDPVAPGYVGVIHDLTDSAERADRFERLKHQHRHLSRVLATNQLGSAIAHELNQPLAALMNYMEAGMTLVDKGDADTSDALYTVMSKAADQAHKASRILSRLRSFVERGEVGRGPVDLHAACTTALALVMPAFRKHHVVVRTHCPPSLPNVQASQVQVEQVLVNLIRNACEAMVEHGAEPMTLSLTGELTGDKVRLTVSDTGPGMDDAALVDAFEPLQSSKAQGLGIGLSLSRDIIRSHKGQLDASRNGDGGMDFSFSLPVATPP